MKNIGRILSLSLLIVLLSCSFSFAAGLELIDSYPPDGGTGFHPDNVMVKLYFNEDVSAPEVQNANESAFYFTDEEGGDYPLRILYSSKNLNEIWVLVDQSLQPDKAYKLEISGDLQTANGHTLGEDKTVEFRTRNTSNDTTGYMGIMAVMIIAMVAVTTISSRREAKKQEAEKSGDVKVNPYKIAKETGKSVEEVVAKVEKEKEKQRAKEEANASKYGGKGKGKEDAQDDKKRVKGPRPISAAGSTYITGRKAYCQISI